MKHALVTLAVLVAALTGFAAASCGASEGAESAGPVPAAPTETDAEMATVTDELPAPLTTSEADDAASGTALTYEVWFARGESLYVTYRTQAATRRVGTAALEALLAGPRPAEHELGMHSQVPEGTQLLGLAIEDGIARVDLTSEFESGGGTLSVTMRLAQVVYTLTQFPTVDGVLFALDGEVVNVVGGEGIVIDHPLTRDDYAELLPAILVASPALGQRVSNPVTVAGSANVFEANVTVRVLDENGREVGGTFTTATCGSGCRGTFSVAVPYDVASEQEGTLVVHDDDAAGAGRPPHEVRIPVVLTPGA